MAKPRGLGRGLASLIPENSKITEIDSAGRNAVDLALIDPNPFQPRRHFDLAELEELSQSIKSLGVLQPVLLRQNGERYQLVSGERRVRAARLVGHDTIPAVIRDVSDAEAMEMALVENLQRADLNPIEVARAYQRLVDELGWTQEQIGERVGKSRPHITNHLRILGMDEDVQAWVAAGELTVAHAKAILGVELPRQKSLAQRAREEGWTVKRLEAEIQRIKEGPSASQNPRNSLSTEADVHLRAVERNLRRSLGTKVVLRGDGAKGRIEIPYRSVDELEHLMELLRQDPVGVESGPDFVV